MNDNFYKRCINIISNLKLSYEESIARDVILNELDMLEKQAEDYQTRFNKAIERLTLKGDIQEKDVIEVFANAIKDTLNILQGSDE